MRLADKFFFVILSVAIGVAALTGVRGFCVVSKYAAGRRRARIMAADLSARMFQPADAGGAEAA